MVKSLARAGPTGAPKWRWYRVTLIPHGHSTCSTERDRRPEMSDADRGIARQIALTGKRVSAPTRSMSLNRPPGRVRHQIVRRTSANRARTDPQNSPTAWSQRRFTRTPASPCASRRPTRSLIRRARRSSVRRSHQRASQSQPLPTRRMTRCAAASKLQPATSSRRLRRCHCIHLM